MTPELDAVELEPVRKAVAQMFECVGVRRVICVDDAYAGGLGVVQEILASTTAEQRAAILDTDVSARMDDENLVHQLAVSAWESGDGEARQALLARAREQAGGAKQGALLAVLEALLPDVQKEGLGLHEWRTREEELIGELGATPTLILFDQSFSNEEPGTESAGQRLIAGLEQKVASEEPPVAYYGLLTNLVQPEEEHERRQQIVDEEQLDSARFVLIAKRRLTHPLPEFAAKLRTMLLAPLFAGLFRAVTNCVDHVRKEAAAEATAIEPEDLEHMVLHSSTREGVWEPETMLRILEILQRSKARAAVKNDPEVDGYVRKLRCLGAIKFDQSPTGVAGEVGATVEPGNGQEAEQLPLAAPGWRIRRQEIYEDRAHINGLHLPIELGDIFQQTDTKLEYILVAQPCDTMVRSRGDREPELTHLILAAIATGSGGDMDTFKLPYYDESTGVDAHVRLSRVKFVRARVLDLCVFDANGSSVFQTEGDAPNGLIPPWEARHGSYAESIRKLLDQIHPLESSVPASTRGTIVGDVKGSPFQATQISPAEGGLAFNCQRVGRLNDPFARALLSRFSQYFARDAEPHDFAREVDE
jgi:hypothetical protein